LEVGDVEFDLGIKAVCGDCSRASRDCPDGVDLIPGGRLGAALRDGRQYTEMRGSQLVE
jgi:hypothetical protein